MSEEFHKITLADKEWMQRLFAESDLKACEFSFSNNYIWREVYQVEVAQMEGCGVCRCVERGVTMYSYPFGSGNRRKIIEKLWKICKLENKKLCFYPIVEEQREELLNWFPRQFEIDADRDDFDYIYTREKLAWLRGKKLHSKRNHIARFCDEKDWSYEALTVENKEECLAMSEIWEKDRSDKWNEEMEQELLVLTEAISLFKELELSGGVLRKAGRIVAFTVGEPLSSDTFVVHFEKAFPQLQGAYPMINQQFVQHIDTKYNYVNREEDTGDEGLRRAKLSYYPDILLKKYVAVESDVVFANKSNFSEIKEIWKECFGDEDAYIEHYLKERFTQENMLVMYQDGKMVSMASFLPTHLVMDGAEQPARYVYAVATRRAYRCLGYAGRILDYAAEKYEEPLILQPADEEVKDYYKEKGFWEAFATKESRISLTKQKKYLEKEIKEITPKEYKACRDAHFYGEGYVCWDEAAISYAMEENALCGGHTVQVRGEILMYRIEDGVLKVIETTMEDDLLLQVADALKKEMDFEAIDVYNAGGMLRFRQQGKESPILQKMDIKAAGEQKGYLGLTLG